MPFYDSNKLLNNSQNIQYINIYANFNNKDNKEEQNKRSLSTILSDKIQKNEENDNLSYNSEYIQKKLEEEEKKNINKYKNMKYEISNANNIHINPVFKNNFMSIKEYFNKSRNKYKNSMRSSNSFDMSYKLESKVFTNLENSFNKKLSINNNITKINKKKITIKCSINEPHKASFTIIVGKKVEISKLKMTICEQLSKKNKVYATLKPNSICLMKNYSFVQEFGTVGDSILSDGDNIYIILIDSMKKAQLNEQK